MALWAFVLALVAVYVLPGPDLVLVLEASLARGRREGLAVALGLALARAGHVALSGLGMAALLKSSPGLFELVRTVGALYLLWLGLQWLRSAVHSPRPGAATSDGSMATAAYRGDADGSRPVEAGRVAAIRRGLLTNLLNPKALLFCSVLLPQFVDSDRGSVWGQFLLLGTILVLIGLLLDVVYVMVAGALRRSLLANPRLRRAQGLLFGAMMSLLALHLLWAG